MMPNRTAAPLRSPLSLTFPRMRTRTCTRTRKNYLSRYNKESGHYKHHAISHCDARFRSHARDAIQEFPSTWAGDGPLPTTTTTATTIKSTTNTNFLPP